MATKKSSSKKQSGKAATAITETKKVNATDRALQVFADTMIRRIESLSEGDNWRKPWFSTSIRMAAPCSIQGRTYHDMNSLFLWFMIEDKGWSVPCFGTFNAFLDMNEPETPREQSICVKKGENAVPVFFYKMFLNPKNGVPKVTEAEYKELSKAEQANYDKRFYMSCYHVFNIDQTNMKEVAPALYKKYQDRYVTPPQPLPEGNAFHIEAMDRMMADNLWVCPIRQVEGDMACFRPGKDEIQLPLYEQFESGEAFYGTAWHEMAHSTGHASRFDRFTKACEQFGNQGGYAFEELIAELSSAMIAHTYGIDKGLKDESAKYLKSWLQALKGDVNYIKQAMMEVGKITKMITGRVEQVVAGEAITPCIEVKPAEPEPVATVEPVTPEPEPKPEPENKPTSAAAMKAKVEKDPIKLPKLPDSQKLVVETDEGDVVAIPESYFARLFDEEKNEFRCKNAAKQFDQCDVVLPDSCFVQPYDFELIGREIDKFNKMMEAI